MLHFGHVVVFIEDLSENGRRLVQKGYAGKTLIHVIHDCPSIEFEIEIMTQEKIPTK
jgi:hypothetical protein